MSHTINVNHQFCAPRESGGGDRPRNMQLGYEQLSEVQMFRDLDLALDRVKVMSSYTVRVGLSARPTA